MLDGASSRAESNREDSSLWERMRALLTGAGPLIYFIRVRFSKNQPYWQRPRLRRIYICIQEWGVDSVKSIYLE